MKTIPGILIAASFVAAIACNSNGPADESTTTAAAVTEEVAGPDIEKDAAFAREIVQDNLLCIQAGELVQAKSSSPEIKQLAQKVVGAHRTANRELESWAQKSNVTLPTDLDEDHQKTYNKLADTENGPEFDKSYKKEMVSGHKDAIKLMEKEADQGKDADLKLWAAEKIPVWQSHLDMIREEETADEKD
jgi:putative membrane protein